MKKMCLFLVIFLSIFFKGNVYADNIEDEIFLYVGEKYTIEQTEGVVLTYISENEEIAAVKEGVITGNKSGETYIVVSAEGHIQKKLHVFVGDYKLCTGQKTIKEFKMSMIIDAWDASVRSDDASVVSVEKKGYETFYVFLALKANAPGIANITIQSRSNVLKSFTVVVQKHSLVYSEQKEPSCSQAGSISHYECLYCRECFKDAGGQEHLDDISIDKTEHTYAVAEMEEATCSKNGYVKYVCQDCQDEYTETLEAGHVYISKKVKPDCTHEGYTKYTCNKCGDSYKKSYVKALGHDYSIVSYINNRSIIKEACEDCGDITYEMNIDGVMVNKSFYKRKWNGNSSTYDVPFNKECSITSSLESPLYAGVDITYKEPIRDSEGKLKIYDIKMIYKDIKSGRVRYDNAVNCVSFSFDDPEAFKNVEVKAKHGVSKCQLNMDYYSDSEDTGCLYYYYDSSTKKEGRTYLILGVTFKMKFESKDKSPYKKVPVRSVSLSKYELQITQGFSKKLKAIYDKKSEYLKGSLKWKSSNKKVATVNSAGKITAKKAGKCTITCGLPNQKKAKCKITVVKNVYNGKSLSECDAYKGMYGNMHFEVNKAYYKGGTFVLKCVVMNTRIFRADKFNWIEIAAKDINGHVIAKKRFENVPMNLEPYGKKYITFTFPKSALKKKRELPRGVWISTDYVYQYSY